MKVYVDELPSCCEDCVCHNGVSGRCKLLHRTTFEIPPRDCPLQTLTDHDKQVRKQVCDEIRKFYTNPVYDRENAHTEVRVLLARLDQIEGE